MDSSKKPIIKSQRKIIALFLFITLTAILASFLLKNSSSSSTNHATPSLSSFIKKACSKTLYSSLCRSTFSTPQNFTNFLDILNFAINQTASHVNNAQMDIVTHFSDQDLNTQEKNALQDCMQMLDQTVYELQQSIDELGQLHYPSTSSSSSSYGNIKTLLSGAMTNENTCINGFLDLEEMDLTTQKGNGDHLRNRLSPVSHMISNTLALIKHVEKERFQETIKKPKMMKMIITKGQNWKFGRRRRRNFYLRPNVTVASDGSGKYRMIGDAVRMAPNMSKATYIIKIKAGVYRENVMVPREKTNIMFVGDGMNSTIITGSRNFFDGFSTFESATLTVMGDKFLARDLTVENTAPPEKHQAVALMVTTNAAFSRCEIKSHQDTLYAHSLRQFYHECIIQGTIDFIFGNAAAVFQNCRIFVRKPIPGQRNTITAQGREDPNQNTGISLQNCTIQAAKELNRIERKNYSTYLGRPWRNYSRVVVVNSYLGDLIHPKGWLEWTDYSDMDSVEYIEYMNSGPGADTRRRITWEGYKRNCSEDEVKQFEVQEFLHGRDNWLESTVIPLFRSS